MFDRIDGFLGRLVFRVIGFVAVIMALTAAYAAGQSLAAADGLKSVVVFVMFSGGALLAGYAARHCFSSKRRFGELMHGAEGD